MHYSIVLKRIVLSLTSFSIALYAAVAQNTLPENMGNQLFIQGMELHEKGHYLASRRSLEKFIAQYPQHHQTTQAKYMVAFNAISEEQPDAEFLMERFVKENSAHPKAATAYYDLGVFYFEQGEYRKSLSYLAKVNFEALPFETAMGGKFKKGYSYYAEGRVDEALVSLEQVGELRNPYYEDAQYYIGFIYFEEGVYEIAIPYFLEAEKSDKYKEKVAVSLATCYLKAHQYENLIAYTKRLGQSKLDPRIQLLTAEAYFYQEDYFNATKQYELAISDRRRNAPVVYYHQGYANYKMGLTEQAIEGFKKAALSSDTLGQYSSYYLGLLYTRDDQKQFALNAFEKAASSDFNATIKEESSFRLGQLSYDLGQFADAINHLRSFVEEYPVSSFSGEANDLLSDAFLQTSNYDLAIAHIESLSKRSDLISSVYQKVTFLKGSQLFNDSQFAQAISNFEKSLTTPIDAEFTIAAHFWKGEAYSIGQKWIDAINSYSRVVFNRSFISSPLYVKSRYGLAYAYYNTKVYDRAKIQFAEYTKALNGSFDQPNYLDALIRLGDCYFVEKRYDPAIVNYEKALQGRSKDIAYIYLQLGLSHGFNNNLELAAENFKKVIRDYPDTRSAERSAYQWALLDFENANYREAITEFSLLLDNYKNSDLVPYALVKRGVANNNLGLKNEAIADYRKVLDEYTSHSVANSALLGLQEAAAGSGSVDIDEYIVKYRRANPNDESLESIEFETAKGRYFSQDYTGAIKRFSSFMEAYPQSSLTGEAQYYIAESHNRSDQPEAALEQFYKVLEFPQIPFYNRSLLRIASLEFDQSNYPTAIEYYKRLGEASKNPKELYNSREGLMRSFEKLENNDSVQWYARRILGGGRVSSSGFSTANLFLGRSTVAVENYDEAIPYLNETINVANDENAAEATYLLGLVYHNQERFEKSNEVLFEMNTKFSIYEFWLGKSFLLIADNYLMLEELFQAKATLNSIIEKSPVEEVREEAKSKLSAIEAREKEILEESQAPNDTTNAKN